MKLYEITSIISTKLSSEEIDKTIKEIESFLQESGGVIIKSEKTNAQILAYPVKEVSSGCFFVLTLQISEDKIKEIKNKLDKDSRILRHIIVVKKPVKEYKERRTRKPLPVLEKETIEKPLLSGDDKKRTEKLNPIDLDKKLDEILSE